MSQSDVVYSCGSCGYPLNLSSSNRSTSDVGSSYQKSLKKDVGLESLSKGCHALKSLSLGYCMFISDRGIGSMFGNCPNICTLIITGCRGLSGDGLMDSEVVQIHFHI